MAEGSGKGKPAKRKNSRAVGKEEGPKLESNHPISIEPSKADGESELQHHLEENEDLNNLELEMEEEFQNSLRILMQEADDGEERSRRIVEMID